MVKKDTAYWKAKMSDLQGAVTKIVNPHDTVIQTVSPSFNFVFGKGWGLPRGYSMGLYGEPKSGKSLLMYLMAGGLHRDYPNAFVIKFNTEFRETAQLTPEWAKNYGIDWDRYMGFDCNDPALIYDQLETQIGAFCQEGMDVGLVIIDSMNGVQGLREKNNTSVTDSTMMDVAKVNKIGLKRILPVQRKYNFGLVMSSHVAVEMDAIEVMRNGKYKSGASVGVQHHCEYSMYVERARNKLDREDMFGRKFVDESITSLDGKTNDTLAHKIYFEMKDSSMGPKLRNGELTFDYSRGVINQHEEVFKLGVGRGVVQMPNNKTYVVGESKWTGKEAFLQALKNSPELQEEILKELRKRDAAGQQTPYDAIAQKESEANET